MSFGILVDVAIGLAITYLLISLMVTTVQESIATVLATRGKNLLAGLKALVQPNGAAPGALSKLTQDVLGHPLIQTTDAKRPPSYLPSAHFGLALLDALADKSPTPLATQVERGIANLPDSSTKRALTVFAQHAGGDLAALKTRLEGWFDDHMERVSGSYRRKAQVIALILGGVLAVALNVDSFRIARVLYDSSNFRQVAVNLGNAQVANKSEPPKSAPATLFDDAMKLPIGWDCPGTARVCDWMDFKGKSTFDKLVATFSVNDAPRLADLLATLLGWLASAIAISLGAPFWFDSLQRLFNLRGAGAKPAPKAKP